MKYMFNFNAKNIAIITALCFCALTAFTLNDYGITWDEPIYFYAGDSYLRWWLNPSFSKIEAYWRINHEHPPLVKLLSGLSHYIFHEKLKLFGHIFSYRLPILIFVFIANYFLLRFMADVSSLLIAFLSTLIFFSLPRIFFHAHLGAFDYPVSALWISTVYLFWKGINETQNIKWILLSAIFLGLAILTKINAFFLYVPFLFIWTWHYLEKQNPSNRHRKFLKLILIFIIPPIMLIIFWPWLWQDTISRILGFVFFHRHHPGVFTYYLGKQLLILPWHYPFIMTFVTLPPMIFLLFIIGFLQIIFHPDKAKIFILFNALFPLILIAIPSVPKYDGVRLFLPAFPFISMIAGLGTEKILYLIKKSTSALLSSPFVRENVSPFTHSHCEGTKGQNMGHIDLKSLRSPIMTLGLSLRGERVKGPLIILIFTGLLAFTIYSSIIKTHPYQSSYYSELIGGVDGAGQKGFELEYWGNAYSGALPWMNQHAQSTFWVYMADLEPIVLWGFDLYKKDGLLKESVKFDNKYNSDYLLLLIRQGFFDEEMWNFYQHKQPVFSVKLGQANLVSIYKLNSK